MGVIGRSLKYENIKYYISLWGVLTSSNAPPEEVEFQPFSLPGTI